MTEDIMKNGSSAGGEKGASLPVVEMFYSLQGEGFHTGEAAFFIRLAGCRNACPFCDTKESWNEEAFPELSIGKIREEIKLSGAENCVITGGEPMLHDLDGLCGLLHCGGLRLWLETSGSEPLSGEWDWICLSPKQGIPVYDEYYLKASELKVVVRNESDLAYAVEQARKVNPDTLLYLQPEWGESKAVAGKVVDFILRNPVWRLSLQTHKLIGIL